MTDTENIPLCAIPGFGVEGDWLLHCLRSRLAEKTVAREHRAQMKELQQGPFDWDRLLTLAQYHSVRTWVYQHFFRYAFENVPQAAHENLSTFVRHNLVSTTLLASNLPKVLGVLSARGVPALPYKGPVLSAILYGDAALREFSDLDILIHQADAEAACKAMIDAGFAATPELSPRLRSAFFRTSTACEFLAPASVFRVELHWKNSGRAVLPFPEEWFWKDKPHVPLGDVEVETVPLLTHLLMLCVHGGKHGWSRLGYLSDIASLLQKYPDLDWPEFWRRARVCGAERMSALAFILVERMLGVTIPAGMDLASHSHGIEPLLEKSLQWMSRQTEPGARYALQLQDTLLGRMRFLTRMAFTPGIKEYSMFDLPPRLHFLYNGVRVARMTGMLLKNL